MNFKDNVNVVISDDAVKQIKKGHPWIFSNSIIKQNKDASFGSIAIVYDKKRKFVAIGLYDNDSPIKIRVLHKGKPTKIDDDFLKNKFLTSFEKRKELFQSVETNGFRLVNGENDYIPGIVIDKYNNTIVLKLDTVFWVYHIDSLVDLLKSLLKPERIILRLSRTVSMSNDCPDKLKEPTVIYGENFDGIVVFKEDDIFFEADVLKGQKTGFFLDQRENRQRVGALSKDADVLNLFAYNGGFSLYSAKNAAKSVTSVDISKGAIDSLIRNFKLNPKIDKEEYKNIVCDDVFKALEGFKKLGRKFSLIIIDPPSFASKNADIHNALKAYGKLTTMALDVLRKNGILVCASCSSRVSSDMFFNTILKSVSHKKYEILDKTFHAIDHPIGFKEGAYLKCIYLKLK